MGFLALGFALVAWGATLLAHLGVFTMPRVLGLAVAGLAALAWSVRRRGVEWLPARGEGLTLAGLGALAAVFYFPGHPVALASFDPGVYLAHASHIVHTGSFTVQDELADPARDLPWGTAEGQRHTGVSYETRLPGFLVVAPGRVASQFFSLYPATMAVAMRVFGRAGAVALNPAVATLGLLVFFVGLRRAGSGFVALGAALLLVTNMIQAWQARFPTAEIVAQVLLLGGIWALLVALQERSALAAGVAGALATLVFLARPDGLLVVAVAALGTLAAAFTRGLSARVRAFAAGLLVPLPHALVQAYGPEFSLAYVSRLGLPSWAALAAVVLAWLALLAGAGAWRRRRPEPGAAWRRLAASRALHVALALAGTTLVILAWLRPWIFGASLGRRGFRTWAEAGFERLTWFLTPAGMLAAWVGFVRAALERWNAARWLPWLPALLLLPVYLYDPAILGLLMWWSRRFVPYVLPGLLALAAFGIQRLWQMPGEWRTAGRAAAAAWLAFLVVACGAMSLPLRGHVELDGSFELADDLRRLGQGRALLLFECEADLARDPQAPKLGPGRYLGAPVWLGSDQLVSLLPDDATGADVERFRAAFPQRPVFLVTEGTRIPPALASLRWRHELSRDVVLPRWEQAYDHRPQARLTHPIAFSAWRLE